MNENLRPHQEGGIAAIRQSLRSFGKQFLLASEVGTGKTRMACEVAKDHASTVIIAPLSTFGGWLLEARTMGLPLEVANGQWPATGGGAVLVNYERLHKFGPQIEAAGLVVWDECHRLKSLKSKRSRFFRALWKLKTGQCHLLMSATPAQTPLEMAYLGQVLGFGDAFWPWVTRWPGTRRNRWGGVDWALSGTAERERLEGLFKDCPLALRRTPQEIDGWPELERVIVPVRLTDAERVRYDRAFRDYLAALHAKGGKIGPATMDLVAAGQFRKRISELKVGATVDLAKTHLEGGKAVMIACEYLEPARQIAERLQGHGSVVRLITGETPTEARQLTLQMSALDLLHCVVFTVQEGINLHQIQDGHRARVQIDHDVRWSALQQHQIDGRTHRAGRFATVFWMTCAGTIDERVARRLKDRMRSMDAINDGMEGEIIAEEILSESV